MVGVTGATGEIGGRLAARLADRGAAQRLIVRDPSRAPELPGAEVATFGGYGDDAGMRAAFAGLDVLFLVSAGESRDRVDQHRAAVDAAAAAGVGRIAYLSFLGAAADITFTFGRDHFHTEEAIKATGVPYTFARDSIYLDYIPLFVGDDDVIRGPAGDGRIAPVSRDDVADSLAEIMLGEGHENATYTLTGAEARTMAELAEAVAAASGREVTYHAETLEEARESRRPTGAPDWEIEGWVTSYAVIATGEMDLVTDDVRRLSGHEPVGIDEFLRAYYAA